MGEHQKHNEQSDAQKNAEGLRKLQEALGQNPDTQEAFGNQLKQTSASERAMSHAQDQTPHGTPGMMTHGPQFNRESYENKNQPKPTSSEDAQRNLNIAKEAAIVKINSALGGLNKIGVMPNGMEMTALKNALKSISPDMIMRAPLGPLSSNQLQNLQKIGINTMPLRSPTATLGTLWSSLQV